MWVESSVKFHVQTKCYLIVVRGENIFGKLDFMYPDIEISVKADYLERF